LPPEIDQMQLLNTIMEIRVELSRLSARLEKLDDFTRSLEEQKRQVADISRRADEIQDKVIKIEESSKSAHKRMDTATKLGYWLLTAIGGSVILVIVNFAMKGGFANP